MKKAQWKQKPHERDRLTPAERIAILERRLEQEIVAKAYAHKAYKLACDERDRNEQLARRYGMLRTKELVVMDGDAKYLTEDTLDAYCDELLSKMWLGRSDAHEHLIANISKLFNTEYAKWLQPPNQK